jgi:hypothetical protein
MIKNSTASALTWLAAILLGLGLLAMSPSGSFLVFIVAALRGLNNGIFQIDGFFHSFFRERHLDSDR